MKIEFLRREPENTRLILIFAGWNAGAEIGRGVSTRGWDVAVVHDFTKFSLDTSFLKEYYTVYVFAWSLGVFAAERLLPPDCITAAFALNGTGIPIDDKLGIPRDIYEGTARELDKRNLMKFRLRMTGSRETLEEMRIGCEGREDDIENLRTQLLEILKQQDVLHIAHIQHNLPWIRAYLSRNDRIFPIENMMRYWRQTDDVETVEMDAPHYVALQKIVSSVIADTEKVSQRFSKANMTYDSNAIAQYSAALKLVSLISETHVSKGGRILEIGCGTGLFTREYAELVQPSEATFVDITPTGPFGIAPSEENIVEDAERWIERQTREWDVILSASAIQWFADIRRFLHLCHDRLAPGGLLAISTFGPGNLEELDSVRPSPIIYPKASDLKEMLEQDFEEVRVIDDEIKIEFQTVREMLMHLKHTGVGGSVPGSGNSMRDMSGMHTLTYRPIYMTARKI